jgi:hypothetical protein
MWQTKMFSQKYDMIREVCGHTAVDKGNSEWLLAGWPRGQSSSPSEVKSSLLQIV